MNIAHHIEQGRRLFPERPALLFEGETFTYQQLDNLSSRVANGLASLGIGRRDRVALLLANHPAFVISYLGILKLGAIAVAVNPALKTEEVTFILNDSGARVVITTAPLLTHVSENRLPQLTHIFIAEGECASERTLAELMMPAVNNVEQVTHPAEMMQADDPAVILYTSGTTGFPKGAILSHGNILSNGDACIESFGLQPIDRVLLCLPVFHCFGQNAAMNPCFAAGATLVLQRQFESEAVLHALNTQGITFFFGVPTLYRLLYEQATPKQLAAVRRFISAASTLPIELAHKWLAKFGAVINEGYGLTETCLNTFNHVTRYQPGSVGSPQTGIGMRIVTDNEEEAPLGELGEVVVQGPNVMVGYWQRPEETAQVLRNGWFHTGDIGRMGADGYIYIMDRVKDMVNVGGTKVYPSEVENVLYRHPAVAEAAVYGVEDALFGEQVCASIVLRAGEMVKPEELMVFCRLHLADFKVPTVIQFHLELPKGRTGKILKRILREQYMPTPTPSHANPQNVAVIQTWIVEWLRRELSLSNQVLDIQRPFAEYGMTSTLAVNLVRSLSDWLAVPLLPILAWNFPTVAALANHLAEQQTAVPVSELVRLDASPLTNSLTADAAVVQQLQSEPIAVIGLGCRFPGGANTPDALWRLLQTGVDTVGPIPPERWDVNAFYDPSPATPGKMYVRNGSFLADIEQFDPQFFGIAPREAVSMDPQQRLLLEVAWEALEHAGVAPDRLQGSLTGVFVGAFWDDYSPQRLFVEDRSQIDSYRLLSNLRGLIAGRLSYVLGLQGPAMQLDTACSSSLLAVHQACQSLRNRECDLALAGGVNLILAPEQMIGLCQMQAVSPDGRCKPFAAQANGFGRGEGCGVVVLKRYADAVRDGDPIRAVVRGSAVNHDGRSNGLTVPNGLAQESLLRQALSNANVTPEQIHYIEAHGTGTILGDPIEVMALANVFGHARSTPLLLGSVKSNFGHQEGAAGIIAFLKVVLALQYGEIPPHLHFHEANPHIPWAQLPFVVPTQPTPWPATSGHLPRLAGISSFGMSGTNVHVIMGETPGADKACSKFGGEEQEDNEKRSYHLLTLSAKNEAALRDVVQRYQTHLTNNRSLGLADVCYTTHLGRTHFNHRLALVAATSAQMQEQLIAFAQGQSSPTVLSRETSTQSHQPIAFLFTGQGSQYAGMGHDLYETQPIFRTTLDRCETILRPLLGESLLKILYPEAREQTDKSSVPIANLIDQTTYTQPALFALEYALTALWQSWGIQPDLLIGHSVGELVAACVAGVFSLEDGLKLVTARGQLMGALPQDGEMVSVMANAAYVQQIMAPYHNDVSIAALNGPENIVISGRRESVCAIVRQLSAEGIKTKRLTVSHAFHSPLMQPMLEPFRQVAASVTYHKPHLRLVSNLTGQLAGDEILTPDYWVQQVRQAVRFADGVKTLDKHGVHIFLEIGPKPVLLGAARTILESDTSARQAKIQNRSTEGREQPEAKIFLPSLREGRNDWQQMLTSLGNLYVQGVKIDWHGFDRDARRRKVVLPTYPFQRQRYWIDNLTAPPIELRAAAVKTTASQVLTLLESDRLTELADLLAQKGHFAPTEHELLQRMLATLAAEHTGHTRTNLIQSLLYEVVWRPTQQVSNTLSPNRHPEIGRWLILADRGGLGAALAEQLRGMGQAVHLAYASDVVQVQPASSDELDPTQAVAFSNLIQSWSTAAQARTENKNTKNEHRENENRETPTRQAIIYLWGLDAPATTTLTSETLATTQQIACGGLLYLVQAAMQLATPPVLCIVTRGAQKVTGEPKQAEIAVAQAPLWGMGRVIANEHPALWGGLIDVEPASSPNHQVEAMNIWQEVLAHADESQLAYRGSCRYVARLIKPQPQFHSQTGTNSVAISGEAFYLITGGLGSLGLQAAQWLAEQGARHLLLTGRQGITTQEQAQVLQTLQNKGVQVQIAQIDVADATGMRQLLVDLTMTEIPLRGVIHTAGVLDDGILLNQNWLRFQHVLAAKTLGAWQLHLLTQNLALDFFVCFSSMVALFGSPGQSNYAAGNCFLDALAHYRQQQSLPALSINWSLWAAGGMNTPEINAHIKATGATPLTVPQATEALAYLLTTRLPQVGVAAIDWRQFLNNKIRSDKFFAELSELLPPTLENTTAPLQVTVTGKDLTFVTQTEVALAQIWGEVLGISAIGIEEDFFALGGDSLMATQVLAHIRPHFGVEFTLTSLFVYPTLVMQAAIIEESIAEQQQTQPGTQQQNPPSDLDAFLQDDSLLATENAPL